MYFGLELVDLLCVVLVFDVVCLLLCVVVDCIGVLLFDWYFEGGLIVVMFDFMNVLVLDDVKMYICVLELYVVVVFVI